jgi:ribose transport system substrate-binding protein
MQMKKIASISLAAAMIFTAFAGCSNSSSSSTATPASSAAAPSSAAASSEAAPAASSAASVAPASDAGTTDWANFTIDASKIPQAKKDTTLYLACSVRGLENPYIVTIIDGMKMFGKYLDSIGQKYKMQTLDSGGSDDKEVNNMKQFAARANGNCIVYSDPNEASIAPSLVKAVAASGGFIGTAWSRPDDTAPKDFNPNWVIHTSPNNTKNSKQVATDLFKKMGGKGEVFEVQGMLGNTSSITRCAGFDEALKDFPDIKVVAKDAADWDSKKAQNKVETWLNKYPNVGGIWCANDDMAAGALQALSNAGKKGKVFVTGTDATTAVVNDVKDGSVFETVSSNGYLQSGYTLAICYAAWTGLIDPAKLPADYREFSTPSIVINSSNVDDYIAKYVSKQPDLDFSKIFSCKAAN